MEKVAENYIDDCSATVDSTDLVPFCLRPKILFSIWIVSYFLLAIVRRFSEEVWLTQSFGIASTLTQTILDVVIIVSILNLNSSVFKGRSNRVILIIGFISAAFADSIYGTWVNIFAVSDTRGTVIELLYNIPFNLFLTCMALAMLRMTTRRSSRLAGQIFGLITMGALILFYFYFSTVETDSTQTAVLTGWSIISESAILLAAGIFFLFGTNIATQLIASGLLVICSTNLLLQYLEFSGQMIPGIPFEAEIGRAHV
jgi:hypothetical protein